MQLFKKLRRWPAVFVVLAISVLATAAVALGDGFNFIAEDNDGLVTNNSQTKSLGNVTPGQVVQADAVFTATCTGNNHLASGQQVLANYNAAGSTTPTGGSISATNVSFTRANRADSNSAAWPNSGTGCPSGTQLLARGISDIQLTAPSTPGLHTFKVKYSTTLSPNTGASDFVSAFNKTPEFTYTMTVVAPSDTTPPTIGHTLDPASPDGDNGWYRSNVSLTWSVNDPESSVTKTGCVDQNITADQQATNYSCSASSTGGGAGPVIVSIKRDATAPDVQRDTASDSCSNPGDNGWCRGTQTAGFTASDATSGLANSGQAAFTQSSSSDGSAVNIASGSVADLAGNSNSGIDAGPFQIDSTPPAVAVTGPQNGATYTLGSVPAAGCTTTDATSDVADHAAASTSGGPVGSVTVNCTGAKDNAGNTGSASVTYSVVYAFTGFFRPIDNGGVYNVVKAGSAVPAKFSLAGNQGLSIFAAGYPTSGSIPCSAAAPIDAVEETLTAGHSSLSYDALADQYNYVWKTDKSWAGTCRQLVVKFADGAYQRANFKLTK